MRISLEQALNILMDHVTHGKTERKTLEDCLGLILSEDSFNFFWCTSGVYCA